MPAFLFTPAPWYAGPSNRRYGMTRGIYAGTGQERLELGRMNIGSEEYEANFSLVLAAPDLFHTLSAIAPWLEADTRFSQMAKAARQALTAATTLHRSA